jgi:antitoxin MazE
MKTQVRKWGNSLAVRIPGKFVKELELQEGAKLEVSRIADGLVLRLPKQHEYTLEELLAKIKLQNLHGETQWSIPVGREAW